MVTSANLMASRVLPSHGRSSLSRPCQSVLISSSLKVRSRGCSLSSFGRLTHGLAVTKSLPASAAQLNRPEAARRMWRALLTEGLPPCLPSTMSAESVAMSCLVTSLAIFLPSRGLMKLRSWRATFSQLSIRGRLP